MSVIGSLEILLRADIARLQRDMDSARQVVGNATAGMERAANAAKAALGGIGAGIGLSQIIQMSDQYAKFTAQLRLASTSAREYAAAYGDVKRIATSAQQDLQATGMLYARIANGTRELGTSQREVAAITETINMALKVSGATAAESASAQLQLSQAFASGTLRGEEFNAVNEAAPRLMKALADGMGVPIGSLKAMATEGKITSAIMADVLPRALEDLRREAKEVQTIAGAFTVLKNNVMEFVGVQANASGGVAVLTGAIGMLANNLGLLAGAVATIGLVKIVNTITAWTASTYGQVAASVALRSATVASVTAEAASTAAKVAQLGATQAVIAAVRQEAVAALSSANANLATAKSAMAAAQAAGAQSFALRTLKLATDELALAESRRSGALSNLATMGRQNSSVSEKMKAAQLAQEVAQANMNKTVGAGAMATSMLTRAVGFLGGPIGAVTTVLGLGALAWSYWGNKAKENNEIAKESAIEASGAIIAELDKQIAKNQRIIEMRKQGVALDQVDKGLKNGAALGALGNDLAALNRGDGQFKSMSNEDRFFAREKIMKSILDLTTKINLEETTGAAAKAITQAEARNKFMGEYATKQDQMNAKLKEARDLLGTSFTAADEARIRKHYEVKVAGLKVASGASKANADALKLAAEEEKKQLIAVSSAINAYADYYDGVMQVTIQLQNEARAQQDGNAQMGMSAKALAELNAARLESLATRKDENAEIAEGLDLSGQLADQYRQQAEALRVRAGAVRVGASFEGSESATQAKELLDILVAVDNATKSAANGMAASFGRVGSAIGGLTVALSEYGVRQQAIVAQMAAAKADPKNGPDKIAKMEIAAAHASAQAKIKSYGDMANAAKGFFKENSTGYKVMEGAERAYRATEMAMAIQTMLTKSGLVTAFTGLFVASKATEIGAETAKTAVSTTLAGTEASAWGITAVVKAIASMPFPANLAAGAATLAAVVALGAKVIGGIGSSGSGGMSAADAQKVQGTGGVFGDSGAKSASIARSLARLEEHSDDLIPLNRGMLTALRNIEASMLGLTNLVVRTDGVVNGDNLGIMTGVISKSLGGLWGKTTQNIVDSGLQFGGSVNALQSGAGYNQYASVDKTKSSWFGLSKKTTNSVQTQGISNELAQQFGKVFTNLESALTSAAVGMGIGASQVSSALNNLVIETTSVSLKGLKGDELTSALNAVLSKTMDQMAAAAFPEMDKFRKVGEGYAETVIRLASHYGQLDAALDAIGMTFGATGLASLTAREDFIALAGGIDDLASKASGFAENFLTEAERLVPVQKYVTEQLAAMSLAHLNSRDAFKAHLLSLNPAIDGERAQIAALLDLQGAFAKVHAATVDLSKSQQEIADERAELQKQLEQMTMTEVQLLAKRRAELDPSNRLLFDQVQSLKAAREAQDAAKTSMSGLIDRMKSFGDSARSLRDGLLTGSLSTLTPEQQYAEARRQRDTTLAAAMGGDTNAQSNLSAMQTAFLTISQQVNGGDSRYSSDFAEVLRISDDVAKWSNGQIDTAQASLNVMGDQLAQLIQMNAALQTVADAASVAPIANIGVPDYSTMGTANTAALVNEVKALRISNEALANEVKGLRVDQQKQTGDLIVAAEAISNRESDTVVKGVGEAINRGAGRYDNGVALA